MNTVEILEKARELISDESRWTQGWFAKDEFGNHVDTLDPSAKCFCTYGALYRVARMSEDGESEGDPVDGARRILMSELNAKWPSDLADFNDEHNHAAVIGLFDRAIELAKAEA